MLDAIDLLYLREKYPGRRVGLSLTWNCVKPEQGYGPEALRGETSNRDVELRGEGLLKSVHEQRFSLNFKSASSFASPFSSSGGSSDLVLKWRSNMTAFSVRMRSDEALNRFFRHDDLLLKLYGN